MGRRRRATVPGSGEALPRPILGVADRPPPVLRQQRSLAKRQRIMHAARAVFAESGYDGASIKEITSRARVGVGAFYIYFRSKRALLVALMDALLARLATLRLRPPAGKRLQQALRAFLAAALRADRDNYGVIRSWQQAVTRDEELAGMQSEIEAWTSARVRGVLATLQRHPRSRKQRDIDGFARLVDRHLWLLLGRLDRVSKREFQAEVNTLSDVIYHYLIRA